MSKRWRLLNRLIIAAGLVALSGCVSAKLVEGRYSSAPGVAVNLGKPWSDITAYAPAPKKVRLLSIDGPALNRLYVAGQLRAGDTLVKRISKDKPMPTLRADMTDTELVEFVVDSVAALGYQRPEATALRPVKIGTVAGVRFDLNTQTSEGLAINGTVLVGRAGAQSHALIYLAPREHYYDAELAEVEQIFASAAFGK
jgi:hypothetical protein